MKTTAALITVLGCIAAMEVFSEGASQQKVSFRWKLTPNQSIDWHLEERLEQVSRIAGSRIEQQTEMSGDFRWNVQAVADDGIATVAQTLDRARVVFRSPTKEFEYDSLSPPQQVDAPLAQAMVRVLDALESASSTVRMGSRGEVVDVEGVSRLVGTAVGMSPFAELIEQTVGDGALESDFRQVYPALPPDPVDIGDRWNREVKVNLGPLGRLDATITYNYRGVERHRGVACQRIDFSLKLNGQVDSDQKAFRIAGRFTEQQSAGTAYFDLERGALVESSLTSRLGGSFKRRSENESRILEIKQTQTLKLLRVEKADGPEETQSSKG